MRLRITPSNGTSAEDVASRIQSVHDMVVVECGQGYVDLTYPDDDFGVLMATGVKHAAKDQHDFRVEEITE